MLSVKQQVVGLIHAYQSAVYHAVELLNAKSARERGFQMHQESPGVWAGYLDSLKQVRYQFHGAGCVVVTPAFKVDFDYAHEGGCTGIDLWFMVDFLKSNPTVKAKYPSLTSNEQVAQALEELVMEGLLIKRLYSADDKRYYLASNSRNTNPPTVTLHMPEEDNSL